MGNANANAKRTRKVSGDRITQMHTRTQELATLNTTKRENEREREREQAHTEKHTEKLIVIVSKNTHRNDL